jgi:putative transposase
MAQEKVRTTGERWKELLGEDRDFFRAVIQEVFQQVLEAEMDGSLQAQMSERTPSRLGYRSGYYTLWLTTRAGTLELRVPQDREGGFSTELFERYQRSEKALVSALAEMYVQGVSTRKVKAITEELCGHAFSASAISEINKKLDEQLEEFSQRKLEEDYPYLILDARYERVRQNGTIDPHAVLVALRINSEGRRCALAVELANRESKSSWKEFLLRLKERGLRGVELVVSDDHPGLRDAIPKVFTEACWQRCYEHFLRNALDYLPRRGGDDCLRELRWLYDRRDVKEAHSDLAAWLTKCQQKYPKLCSWVEENIEQTLTFYRFPPVHHKHIKSTNMLERLNQEIKLGRRLRRHLPACARKAVSATRASRACPRFQLSARPGGSRRASAETGDP